tara:strand:- start:156 stop:1079 length:924 start_codon:yes stop_codon:yes gene_type:complete
MQEYVSKDLINFDILPKNIKVSTISATCYLGVNLDLNMIYKYMNTKVGGIVTIKYKNDIRSIPQEKHKKRKKKKNCFQNQMTVEIRPELKEYPDSKISIKIFKNGSIQMSGIKNIIAVNQVLTILIDKLSESWGYPGRDEETGKSKMIDVSFIEDDEKIAVSKFKIDMINCGFVCDFQINRENLYNELTKNKIESKYEPTIHAGVNIKYYPEESKKVSIFTFESGNVIITGAKNINHILEAYNFIDNFIKENKEKIQKNKIYSIMNIQSNKELSEFMNINDDNLLQLAINDINDNDDDEPLVMNNTL